MTRDEWNHVLATERATSNQRGAIMREFGRLGFHDERDRAERLGICTALLGLDELGSTSDLVMGQAGQLVNILQNVRDRGELADVIAAADDVDQDDEDRQDQDNENRITFTEMLIRVMVAVYIARQEKDRAGKSPVCSGGNIARDFARGGV